MKNKCVNLLNITLLAIVVLTLTACSGNKTNVVKYENKFAKYGIDVTKSEPAKTEKSRSYQNSRVIYLGEEKSNRSDNFGVNFEFEKLN